MVIPISLYSLLIEYRLPLLADLGLGTHSLGKVEVSVLRVTSHPGGEMCERARRYLKATLPSRVKRYFPRGPQIFYHGQHCVSPNWPVWRIPPYTLWVMGLTLCIPRGAKGCLPWAETVGSRLEQFSWAIANTYTLPP